MKLDDLGQHPCFIRASRDSIDVHNALGLKMADAFDDSTTLDELQFYVTRVGFSLSHTRDRSLATVRIWPRSAGLRIAAFDDTGVVHGLINP